MQAFAALLDRLYYTNATSAKAAILADYLRRTPDPDRGFAVGAIAGTLSFELFKRALVRDLVAERVDPVLLAMSYDYVGEMSETVAHIWPRSPRGAILNRMPPLHEVVHEFQTRDKPAIREYLALLLGNMTPPERWALLKLGMRTLRIGMSARSVKHVLAGFGGVGVGEIEEVWHAREPPYLDLFAWLEGRGPKPDCKDAVTFHPVMLAHAIEEAEVEIVTPADFMAEWKYDGIRVQVVSTPAGKGLFSRTGDGISGAFPEVLARVNFEAVLDGELIVKAGGEIASFNHLQQRLNRKSPDPKLIAAYPGHIILYDALAIEGRDLRPLPLTERKAALARWFEAARPGRRRACAAARLPRSRRSASAAGRGRHARLAAYRRANAEAPRQPLRRRPAAGPVVQVEARSEARRRRADVRPARHGQALAVLFGLHLRALARGRAVAHREGVFRLHG